MTGGSSRPRPRKRFGQHFLEQSWSDRVVRAIAPRVDETFVEIGPGRGAVTKPLAARARHVVAFEIDRDLVSHWRGSGIPNITVIEGDFLRVSPDRLREALDQTGTIGRVRVAGNLPYNVASPMLFQLVRFFAAGLPLIDATVMVQREVAERLTSAPGTRDYGVLTVLIGYRASTESLLRLPRGAFRPAPKVESALVRLTFHRPQPAPADENTFEALVQAVFTRRRKTLTNALKGFMLGAAVDAAQALRDAALDGRRRPETLTISELVRLADVYEKSLRESPLSGGGVAVL